jgi:riboflavin kinase/FMN adenylyltransferase
VQLWNRVSEVPDDFGPSVVTIGNFDGVHRGHRAVIARLVARARERDVPAVAITFHPHPLMVLQPDRAPAQLTTLDHRLDLLSDAGLDAVLVMEFTPELAARSPRDFVHDVLVQLLGATFVVVGPDTRFGYRNSGDVDTMRVLGEEFGFGVEIQEDLGELDVPHHAERRWSSTWVRELIAEGAVHMAAQVLGRPHRVTGVVVHGDHRGRTLGFPTANLSSDAVGMVPEDGVYAGWLLPLPDTAAGSVAGAGPGEQPRWPAAISIGTNPTFDGVSRRVEAYVLDRDDLDLYGKVVAVEFIERLRPTMRFDGVDSLVQQMTIDVRDCHKVLDGLVLPR